MWNYYRDQPSDPLNTHSESFKNKNNTTGSTYNIGVGEAGQDANKAGKKETEIAIPLNHVSNFWRNSNIPLINCVVELVLNWSKNCVLADMTVRTPGNNNNPPGNCCTNWIRISNNRHKIIHTSCYFIKKKIT